MSIEELFKSVIAALEANTAAVKLLESTLVGRSVKTAKEEKAEAVAEGVADAEAGNLIPLEEVKAKHVAKSEERKAKEVQVETLADDVEAVEEFVQEITEPVAYETVRKLVLALAPTKRDAIKALNAKHGINNLKALLDKEDDFSTVNDQVKLEAVYADLQALGA